MIYDQKLAAESVPQDPAAVWQPKPVSNGGMTASAKDYSGLHSRAVMQDGRVVSTEVGGAVRASTADAFSSPQGQGRPIEYALNFRTRDRIAMSDITDDSIIRFAGGAEMTAKQARLMGWLHSPSPSTLEQPRTEQPMQQQQEQEVHPDLQAEPLADTAVEASLDQLVKGTTGIEQMSAVKEIVQNGEISANTLGRLASQLRTEANQLQGQLAPIMAEFERQGRAAFSEGGLDADDVIRYAQTKKADALRLAMHKHGTERSTAGYKAIRASYLADLADYNPQAALAADLGPGVTSYQDHKGRVMVRVPGYGEMEWSSAIRAFAPK